MKRIPHQLMELNSTFIWHWPWFVQGVASAKQHGFTGIILHQQELLSILATPSPLSTRLNVENLIHQQNYAVQYLKRVSLYLQEQQLTFWLQGEAAPSDDIIKRKFPEFAFDEKSAPDFWPHFYATILTSLLPALPHFGGLILSLTTPSFQTSGWQQGLRQVWSMLRAQGKKLILRDFIDHSWPRQQLSSVLSQLPDDVRASIKATELDYHPGFANHPHIATLPGHKKWIEYDLWGTGYGWTILPCYLGDEISGRLSWALSVTDNEVEAITSRVTWQWLPDSRVTESANAINLTGLTAANQPSLSVFDTWSEQHGLRFRQHADKQRLAALLHSSYDWLCKTPNLLGRRLHYQSQVPLSLAQAQQLLHMDTRSANWMQAYQPLMPADDRALGEEQRQLITLEKETACFLAAHAVQSLRELAPRIVCADDTLEVLLAAWRNAEIYSQMFSRVSAAVSDLTWGDHYGEPVREVALRHQQVLLRYADTLARWVDAPPPGSPLFLPLLLSPERLSDFARSLTELR
ncbi:hypothetical protein [Enterobacter sp.]|uniref:hypothetical protein n=1 Tax=Enterobacter sp. TaxID=42895 RepID=UPI00296E4186|nr:hypothetical protein [Enterobacter sp.]